MGTVVFGKGSCGRPEGDRAAGCRSCSFARNGCMVVRRRRPGNARGGESAAALLACGPSVTVSGCDVRSPTAWAAGAAVDGEAAKVPDGERVAAIAEVAGNVQVVSRALFLVGHCGVRPGEILTLAFNRKAVENVR